MELKSSNNKVDAQVLLRLEDELNTFRFAGMPIGGLLAANFNALHNGTYKPAWSPKMILLSKIFLNTLRYLKLPATKAGILYYKSGSNNHHNKLFSVVESHFDRASYFVYNASGSRRIGIAPGRGWFMAAAFFMLKHRGGILRLFGESGFNNELSKSLYADLWIQLNRLMTWEKFFKESPSIHLLVGDYDRGNESAAVYLVAKKLGLKNIVLQHGVINPPYGYFPLIADKVFVWGEIQQQQYMKMHTDEKRIVVTGTPIVERMEILKEKRADLEKEYGLTPGKKNVVLGINPIKFEYNEELIRVFAETLHQLNKEDYDFYIKLHPSQKEEQYNFIQQIPGLSFWKKEIHHRDFFVVCDVLITHNSGIANEAIFYEVPVGILDVLSISAGNGKELNTYLSIPLLKSSEELASFLESLEEDYPLKNGEGVEQIYFKTGNEARQLMALQIENHLR